MFVGLEDKAGHLRSTQYRDSSFKETQNTFHYCRKTGNNKTGSTGNSQTGRVEHLIRFSSEASLKLCFCLIFKLLDQSLFFTLSHIFILLSPTCERQLTLADIHHQHQLTRHKSNMQLFEGLTLRFHRLMGYSSTHFKLFVCYLAPHVVKLSWSGLSTKTTWLGLERVM